MPLLRRAARPSLLNKSPFPLNSQQIHLFDTYPIPSLPQRRNLSSSPTHHVQTQQRSRMWAWLKGPGAKLRFPHPNGVNYLGGFEGRSDPTPSDTRDQPTQTPQQETNEDTPADPEADSSSTTKSKNPTIVSREQTKPSTPSGQDIRPFPLNNYFYSERVLSEELKEEIWRRVRQGNKTAKEVSQALKVDMARVAAVVRMKEIEKQWIREKKPLARPYARALSTMLPQTPFDAQQTDRERPIHESINMLPVHGATKTQLFVPAAESRRFTRVDAALAFRKNLLPAEARIPHPDMVERARQRLAAPDAVDDAYVADWTARLADARQEIDDARAAEQRRLETVKSVHSPRWDFRFEEVDTSVHAAEHGEKRRGVGWRYGVPLNDRKKGKVKIPTQVDV